jgi:hypothetical protein
MKIEKNSLFILIQAYQNLPPEVRQRLKAYIRALVELERAIKK